MPERLLVLLERRSACSPPNAPSAPPFTRHAGVDQRLLQLLHGVAASAELEPEQWRSGAGLPPPPLPAARWASALSVASSATRVASQPGRLLERPDRVRRERAEDAVGTTAHREAGRDQLLLELLDGVTPRSRP